ncbi:MAG: hypothetical protein Q8K68_12970 [Nitrospirota bacterium]|nr:hypothetical protein [Nitrospirota bacterium]
MQTMSPAPSVPEEAKKYFDRGMAAAEDAKNEKDFKDASDEFQKAVNIAPWLGAGYRGLAVSQEKAGQYSAALQNLKLFLLTNPSAEDAEKAKTLRNKIEYRMEKAAKESSPEAVAAKQQNKAEEFFQRIIGARYILTVDQITWEETNSVDIYADKVVLGDTPTQKYQITGTFRWAQDLVCIRPDGRVR